MAHIYVCSPSSAVRDRAALRRGLKRLQSMGHEVELDPEALARETRFAGGDEQRLAALGRAAASGADAVMTTRGGYGLSRLLPRLDEAGVHQAIKGGQRWIGFSDFTALQLALLARHGSVSWAGPAVIEDLGARPPDDITLDCLQDVLEEQSEGAGWRLPPSDVRAHPALAEPEGWDAGSGVLWGGNLSLLVSLLGTPYMPRIKGGFLFVEDVGEAAYRVERMLVQLLQAEVLGRQKALLLGRFSRQSPSAQDRGYRMDTVVAWLRRQLPNTPVLTGLPFGHVPTKLTLPVGCKVRLLGQGREALLLWG